VSATPPRALVCGLNPMKCCVFMLKIQKVLQACVRTPLLALALLASLLPHTASAHDEKYHAEALCKDKDQEVTVTNDRTRIDCYDRVFAYEVDWSHKWHEGIGQALYYASAEKRPNGENYLPGLILVCSHVTNAQPSKIKTCEGHFERAAKTFEHHAIEGQIWLCLNTARRRSECETARC